MDKRHFSALRHSSITAVSQHQSNPTHSDRRSRILHMAASFALGFMTCGTAMANPEGGQVVRGNATISGGAGTLNIHQNSDRASINWRSFSIGANETVNFFQPSASSSTLNRVTGSQRSVIEGALNANGRVYLINPSGVLFTGSARVDVGALVATTANVGDDDFMAGRLSFREPGLPGSEILNYGTLTIRDGGLAALVAPSVRNYGLIQAELGQIALGAGDAFTLDFYGDRLINFVVADTGAAPAGSTRTVENHGSLVADGGQVLLTVDAAAGVLSGVVNMSGIVQARSLTRSNSGAIVLDAGDGRVSVAGTLDARGAEQGTQGGFIEVLGREIELASTASIAASGPVGGGTVYVGGPPAAIDASRRAIRVDVSEGAVIDASARDAGDGGTVSIWGDEKARFAGLILNRGGSEAGDGGFVEVSSRGDLQFLGDVDTTAPSGRAGIVLLDPDSITVEQAGSDSLSDSVISADALSSMLRRGMPVILDATNSITVNHIIDGRPTSGSPTTPSGSVEMSSGAIIINAPVITSNASITLTARSGDVTIRGDGFLYVANGAGVGSAALTVTAEQGAVNAMAGGRGNGQLISLGPITLRAKQNITLEAALAGLATSQGPTGIGRLTLVSEEGRVRTAGANVRGDIEVQAAAGVELAADDPLEARSLIAEGSVRIDGGSGPVTVARIGNSAATAGIDAGGDVRLVSAGGVQLGSGIRTGGGRIEVGTATGRAGSVAMAEGVVLETFAGTTPAGEISIYSRGDVVAGALNAGVVRVDTQDGDSATTGNVTLAGQFGRQAGESATGIGSLEVAADGAVSLAGVRALDEVQVSGSSIANAGSSIVSVGGDVALTAAAGGITLAQLGDSAATAGIDAGGDVRLVSAGGVQLGSGIRTEGGDIVIATSQGDIEVLQAANVLGDGESVVPGLFAGGDGEVVLLAPGAVLIEGGIVTEGGNICIGGGVGAPCAAIPSGATPVGSLLASHSTLIQSVDPGSQSLGSQLTGRSRLDDERIWINASGAVEVGHLVAGFDGGVSIAGERVLIAQAIQGPVDTSEGADGERLGVGFVNVTASGTAGTEGYDLDMAGASVSGFCVAAEGGGSCVDQAESLRLVVAPGGRVAVRGILSTDQGGILIGLENPPDDSSPNAQLALNTSEINGGGPITINADIVLWEGVDRWSAGLDAAGVGFFEDEVDPIGFFITDPEDSLLKHFIALSPSGCCLWRDNEDNNGETPGGGSISTFRFGEDTLLLQDSKGEIVEVNADNAWDGWNGDVSSNGRIVLDYFTILADGSVVFDQGYLPSVNCVGDCWGGPPVRFAANDSGLILDNERPLAQPEDTLGSWARSDTVVGVDAGDQPAFGPSGEPVNSQVCGDGRPAMVCGLNLSAPLEEEIQRTAHRISFFGENFVGPPAFLSTVIRGKGETRVNGNVTRFDPCADGCGENGDFISAFIGAIWPSSVGHQLILHSDQGKVTINGTVSDSVAQADRTGFWNFTGDNELSFVGGPSFEDSISQAVPFVVFVDASEYQVNDIGYVFFGSVGGGVGAVDRAIFFNSFDPNETGWLGNEMNYTVNVRGTQIDVGTAGTPFDFAGSVGSVPAFNDLQVFGSTALAGSGPVLSGGQGGGAGLSAIGLVVPPPGPGGEVDVIGLPATAEDDSRRSHVSGDDDASGDDEDVDVCIRGAAKEADIGLSPSIHGASAEVFAWCPELQSRSRAAGSDK